MSKQWTDEQRKAFGEKMKKAREAKKVEEPKQPPVEQKEEIKEEPSVQELMAMIEELKRDRQQPQQAQVTNRGLIGTTERYPTDKGLYPDPVPRLMEEQKLAPFAFKINYDLGWGVDITSYETIDGMRMKEPKFTLQLNRIVLDDAGEPTNKRWVVKRVVMHEEPETAVEMAREAGLPVDDSNELEFLNEMRYLRLRNWLLDVFYPPKKDAVQRKKQDVIGGKVVEVFEVNSENSSKIPFDQLNSKL